MKKTLIFTVLAIAALLALGSVPLRTAEAQQFFDKLTVVAIDRYSISSGDANDQLVNTFVGLLCNLKEDEPVVFVFTDDLSDTYGPLYGNADDSAQLRSQVSAAVGLGSASAPVDIASSLSSIYDYMTSVHVREEASIYLVTASEDYTASDQMSTDITSALAPIVERGWNVFAATAPGTNSALVSDLDKVSVNSGGESFALTMPEGIEGFMDRSLRMKSQGALNHVGQANLSDNPVFEVDLDIVPSTRWANVVFVREDPQTSFRITNPDGLESSYRDRTSSSVIELPHMVIWQVTDPVQGNWKAEARGGRGVVSANLHLINRYTVELQDMGAVPVDHPETLIVAAVLDRGELVSPDATVEARVIGPSGDSIIHELNDAGVEGDSIPLDGYFSLTLPPLKEEGRYDVELRLSWPDVDHSIISLAQFEAQHFPTIEVTPNMVEGLKPGVTEKIASVFVNINGQPYTALADEVTVSVSGGDETPAGEVTKIPHEVVTLGKSYGFDIYYTPPTEIQSSVIFGLSIEYAGRQYIYSTDSMVVSSLPIPASVGQSPAPVTAPIPAPAAAAPAPAPAPPAAPPVAPPPQVEDSQAGFPTEAIIIALAAIGIAALGVILYWLTRPTPFGYMYTEEGELLVDFGGMVRRPVDNIMKRSRIDGNEIDLPGFGGVSFLFASDTVTMVSVQVLPNTVRVNNQPVTDTMTIHDNSLIGASGRIYFFRYISPEIALESGNVEADDDDNERTQSYSRMRNMESNA
ncbi:MAG: hypothetical protein F4X94_00870 [Dehalococcoidia bacterium]|nr:hypothetical protein [Dehalococcoidia bacterium]